MGKHGTVKGFMENSKTDGSNLFTWLSHVLVSFKLDKDHNIISFPIGDTRILGVLQRIALCYGIAALMIYIFLKYVHLLSYALFYFFCIG